MLIASLLNAISAYERFHRKAVLWDWGGAVISSGYMPHTLLGTSSQQKDRRSGVPTGMLVGE